MACRVLSEKVRAKLRRSLLAESIYDKRTITPHDRRGMLCGSRCQDPSAASAGRWGPSRAGRATQIHVTAAAYDWPIKFEVPGS